MKYLLLLVVATFSTSTFANRVISAMGGGYPMGHDRASACEDAKTKAGERAHQDEEVKAYSRCECSKADGEDNIPWTCTVNATVGKKDGK